MPITVLFDLDDTLLNTNMGHFLPAYFRSLGQVFSDLATQKELTAQIQFAVREMTANQDPGRMLNEIFADHFYQPLGTSKENCQDVLNYFYNEEFPKLKPYTQPKPEAENLVKWCQSQSMLIAIATNPLFPETATRQRIEWAGLNPNDFIFFSTFDNFHFTKPNLSYYAECLGRLGWPETQTVMVGDNINYDLQPVEKMGCKTFLISPNKTDHFQPQGKLSHVKPWLNKIPQNGTLTLNETPEVLTAILRSTPAVFDTWLRKTPSDILYHKPSKRAWSLVEVLWHLADFENEVHKPQWKQLLADSSEPVTPVDTSKWAQERKYLSRDPHEGLMTFLRARLESLLSIQTLLNKNLFDNTVQHMVFTKSTIKELINFAAKHDRLHLQQCFNLLNIS